MTMLARDANNATWYLLRYAMDFTPRAPKPLTDPVPPQLDPTLFYDEQRHVLELLPKVPQQERQPLPGIAVDVDGEVYRTDGGQVLVRRCDGSEVPLVCQPQVFARPAGLALDRRGFLYVADPFARRVVAILPEDGNVQGVLDGELQEPVDVAAAPDGRLYVADRAGGSIGIYSPRYMRLRSFASQNGSGLPAKPRPIAVMIDTDGSVLVADANHPRLLHFDRNGKPLGDLQLAALTAQIAGGDVALDALEKAYGKRLPRFFTDTCCPPFAERDGGERLAEVHRALRLLRLRLGAAFEPAGVFLSAALDSGTPGTTWHRVEVDANLADGTQLVVETATAEHTDAFASAVWAVPERDGKPIPITPEVADQLIQSPPGRYLRLRVTLRSDGRETPSLRSIKVLYPRVSYLDLLPRIYRRDPDGSRFLERFLALFERLFTDIENRYEDFSRELNPDAAPLDVINWLACLIDLSFDPSWSLVRRRALVAAAMDLYRRRGTIAGIERYVEIYTGIRPLVQEAFLRRPGRAAFLGSRGSILGCSLALTRPVADQTPEQTLFQQYAHRFTVLVYLADRCDEELLLPVVDRIVSVNKPAQTVHTIYPVYAETRVGIQSTVGLDFVVGGQEAPRTRLGGCPAPAAGTGVLGVDSILGERRPQYVRRWVGEL
jgi:phage tail-like protein